MKPGLPGFWLFRRVYEQVYSDSKLIYMWGIGAVFI